MSINSVNLTGNLTRDAELKQTSGGTAIVKMRLAVNGREKRGNEWQDRADYVDLTMFGARAEAVSRYLHKGTQIGVSGRLRYSEWAGDGGSKRSKLEVLVDELELLGGKGKGSDSSSASAPVEDFDLEDIPF